MAQDVHMAKTTEKYVTFCVYIQVAIAMHSWKDILRLIVAN